MTCSGQAAVRVDVADRVRDPAEYGTGNGFTIHLTNSK